MSAGDRDTLVSLMVKHQRCEIRFDIAGAFFPDCDMRLDGGEYDTGLSSDPETI